MTVPDRRPVTAGLVTMIATATGKPCGDQQVPDGLPVTADPSEKVPYSVVHEIDGGGYWGPGLVAPEQCADFVYQIDSVGFSPAQCRWLADRNRRTMLARSSSGAFRVAFPAVTGLAVADRMPETNPGGMDVGGKHPHQVFTIAERFTLRVVPA